MITTEEESWEIFPYSADHRGAERGAHAFGFKAGRKAGLQEAAEQSCGCITTNPESGDGPVLIGEDKCERKGCGRSLTEHAFGVFCP